MGFRWGSAVWQKHTSWQLTKGMRGWSSVWMRDFRLRRLFIWEWDNCPQLLNVCMRVFGNWYHGQCCSLCFFSSAVRTQIQFASVFPLATSFNPVWFVIQQDYGKLMAQAKGPLFLFIIFSCWLNLSHTMDILVIFQFELIGFCWPLFPWTREQCWPRSGRECGERDTPALTKLRIK